MTMPNVPNITISIRRLCDIAYHVLADVVDNVESNPWFAATISLSVMTGLLVIVAVILLIVVIKQRTGTMSRLRIN